MNNYPMNFIEFNVEDGCGNNLAPGLHSFDIETFEVLMHASRYAGQHNILDMLLECYRRRYEMSPKTVIKRLIDQMYKQGFRTDNVYNKIKNEALERHRSYFQGFTIWGRVTHGCLRLYRRRPPQKLETKPLAGRMRHKIYE